MARTTPETAHGRNDRWGKRDSWFEITARGSSYRAEIIGEMFSLVRDLRWDNTSPLATFATIIVMPVTYSIANGVGVGILLHTLSELLQGRRVNLLLLIFSGFFVWYFVHGTV